MTIATNLDVEVREGASMLSGSTNTQTWGDVDVTQGGGDRLAAQMASQQLVTAVRGLHLPCFARADAEALSAELRRPAPDRRRIRWHLDRLATELAETGAPALAGASLERPLARIARWLGGDRQPGTTQPAIAAK